MMPLVSFCTILFCNSAYICHNLSHHSELKMEKYCNTLWVDTQLVQRLKSMFVWHFSHDAPTLENSYKNIDFSLEVKVKHRENSVRPNFVQSFWQTLGTEVSDKQESSAKPNYQPFLMGKCGGIMREFFKKMIKEDRSSNYEFLKNSWNWELDLAELWQKFLTKNASKAWFGRFPIMRQCQSLIYH